MRKWILSEKEKSVQRGLIQSDPSIMMGKPVVAGTSITVELIPEKLAAGETIEQILGAHPRLTEEGIRAALAFCGGPMTVEEAVLEKLRATALARLPTPAPGGVGSTKNRAERKP